MSAYAVLRPTRVEQDPVIRWDRDGGDVHLWSASPVTGADQAGGENCRNRCHLRRHVEKRRATPWRGGQPPQRPSGHGRKRELLLRFSGESAIRDQNVSLAPTNGDGVGHTVETVAEDAHVPPIRRRRPSRRRRPLRARISRPAGPTQASVRYRMGASSNEGVRRAARFSAATSIFCMLRMACITRSALPSRLSCTSLPMSAGTMCHDTPNCVLEPAALVDPARPRRASFHRSSISRGVLQLATSVDGRREGEVRAAVQRSGSAGASSWNAMVMTVPTGRPEARAPASP